MFVLTRKIRILLATAMLGLLLIAPVVSPAYAGDCGTISSPSCGG